jgi:hypothetical protein
VAIVRPDRLVFALLLMACPAAGAAELGTLFHTPEERARLEKLRRGEALEPAPTHVPARPEVTGFVRRSDGRNTVWINGIAVPVTGARGEALMDPEAVVTGDEGDVKVERGKDREVKR